MFTRLCIVICPKLQHLSCLKSILSLCGTAVPHFQPMYALSLFVYLDLAGDLSHTLNIFIFSCNFPGTFPNLTRERSIPLFRLRLPVFQISCLLLWLQRDANILVQALRSIQHTTDRSVFHFCCPSRSCSFSHHSLSCFHPLTLSLLPIRKSKVVFVQYAVVSQFSFIFIPDFL